MSPHCEGCDEQKPDVQVLEAFSGRDYPGVGGGMAPPESVALCADCRGDQEPEYDDVECMVCGDTIENHCLEDPPKHRDCDLADMEPDTPGVDG